MTMFTRRRFLQNSSLVAASTIGFPHVVRSAESLQMKPGQKPRHIIHLVADGMSMGTLTAADHFSQLQRSRGLTWMELFKSPVVHAGWMNMRSLNSLVTDSSAASSSWGSGTRIINGMLNQRGNGQSLKCLYELFQDAGWRRGLVTTTEITHATPAGFAVSVEDRGMGDAIAAQYLERKVDLLLGGGLKFFDASQRKDKRDLRGEFAKAGYFVMDSRTQLEAAPTDQRWLGTFASGHLPFTLDHLSDAKALAQIPTLAMMTRSALKWLEKENHFILQVEGGRVDMGAHNCDAAAALHDQIAFDEALDVCLEFHKHMPDTLLIVTTDHGTANLGLNGIGPGYGQSSWLFRNLRNVKSSFPEILRQLKGTAIKPPEIADGNALPNKSPEPAPVKEEVKAVAPKNMAEIIVAATGYKVPLAKLEMLTPFLTKKGASLYDLMNSEVCALGQLMANYLGISFTGNSHTADYVPIVAVGPGAERFRGFIQNTDVFHHYLSFAGIDFRNPEEPLIAEAGPDVRVVEKVEEYQLA